MTKILKRMITRIKFMISITIGTDKLGKGGGGHLTSKCWYPRVLTARKSVGKGGGGHLTSNSWYPRVLTARKSIVGGGWVILLPKTVSPHICSYVPAFSTLTPPLVNPYQ